jgi:broad specificity phosphatase PhoE
MQNFSWRELMKWSWLVLVGMLCMIVFDVTQAMSLNEYAEKPFGRVLMLRHALAPGFGDPSNFQLRDCSTQRILDEVGREQSRQIGNAFQNVGLRFEGVYSSQWCRCLETAYLINIGKVQELTGLNSFFQGIVPREATLASLQKFLQDLSPDGDPILLVTHQVTISAITGISVSSGAAVAYDQVTKQGQRVTLPTD